MKTSGRSVLLELLSFFKYLVALLEMRLFNVNLLKKAYYLAFVNF